MNYLDKLKIAINSSSIEISFSELKDPVDFLDRRKKCGISTQEAWHKQEEFNKYLKELKINLKNKKKSLVDINRDFKERNDHIKFVDDSNSIILEAKIKVAGE